MRHAPPVHVPVGRFSWGVRLAWSLALLSLWPCLLLALSFDRHPGRAVLAATAWLAAAALCAWTSRHAFVPAGELRWDGQGWHYGADGLPARQVLVAPVWDLGWALLLAVRAPGHRWTRHAWLTSRHMPAQWHGLRCALFDNHTF